MKPGKLSCLLFAFLLIVLPLRADTIRDDAEALKLLNQAGIAYSIEENYDKALDLLVKAVDLAVTEPVRGRILLETAYVRWMRLESPLVVRDLLARASRRIDPAAEEYTRFPQAFLRLWKKAARSGPVRTGPRRERFQLEVVAVGMASADTQFTAFYGRWQFMPEVRLGISPLKNWWVWGSYSTFSFSGVLPVIEVELEGFQRFLVLGVAWEHSLGRQLALRLGGGVEWMTFEERASMEEVSENLMGFRLQADLRWRFSRGFYLCAGLGYGAASGEYAERTLRPGGFRLGTGLGVRF